MDKIKKFWEKLEYWQKGICLSFIISMLVSASLFLIPSILVGKLVLISPDGIKEGWSLLGVLIIFLIYTIWIVLLTIIPFVVISFIWNQVRKN